MLDLFKRTVHLHELRIDSEPEHATPIAAASLFNKLKPRIKNNQSHKLINNQTAAIRCKQFKEYKNAIVLLIQYTDTQVTSPVFSKLDTGELRKEPLLEGEGVAVSAHIVIKLTQKQKNLNAYEMLVEEVPGIGRSRISDFLRSEFKTVSKNQYTFNDLTDGNKEKKVLPASKIHPTPKSKLGEDLLASTDIKEVEFYRHVEQKTGIDEDNYFIVEKETARAKITTTAAAGGLKKTLTALSRVTKNNKYDGFRIKYKSLKNNKRIKTAVMNADEEDIFNALICESYEVSSNETLPQCSDKIIETFAEKMLKLFK